MNKTEIFKANQVVDSLISKLNIDLSGLNLITEIASGAYLFNLLISIKSNANVFAVGKDSRYGKFSMISDDFNEVVKLLDLQNNKYELYQDHLPDDVWSKADIITNSGFVRPIDKRKISLLKHTSVIPLMWETWEYRKGDVDLIACQKKQIPVIGTSEKNQYIDIYSYSGFMTLKLLFQLNIEIFNNNIILIGSGKLINPIVEIFQKLGLKFKLFSINAYKNLKAILKEENIDCIVCAELLYDKEIVGKNSSLSFKDLHQKFPHIKWGHIAGNIDMDDLRTSGIEYYPEVIQTPGYMSYQAYYLGIRPVLELFAGGLKVGEIATRARMAGLSIEETIQKTINYGIGQDFKGGFLQFKP